MVSIEEIEFYKSIINELNIVFDVGCQHDNIFDELKSGIEVHLFDPTISLELKEKINGKKNIKYNNVAIGSDTIAKPFYYHYGSFIKRDDEEKLTDHSSRYIDVITIYKYCKDNNINSIDFLKIDTEGFDFEVILGCHEILNSIKYIQFEHWTNEMVGQIIEYLPSHQLIKLNSKPKNYIVKL